MQKCIFFLLYSSLFTYLRLIIYMSDYPLCQTNSV
nr:MAG TPA: hypothetical protein [Caudoviricetes sp.]